MSGDVSYAAAGVDIDAADEAVRRLTPHVRSTFRPEVLSDVGGFGSVVAIPAGYDEPVLVSGNDGAGTKTLVAAALGRYDTIGIDVVAKCVDDIVTSGAEPLFLLDQITVGSVDPDRIEQFVLGFSDGCRQAGCALTGGEIAEHPDAMAPDDFDLAGFTVGVAEKSRLVTGERCSPGDVLMGLASPGLRCNGYSLARRVLMDGRDLDQPAWSGADTSLGEELLRPSVIYAPTILSLFAELDLRGAAHITGGGLAANLSRSLGGRVDATIERGTWRVPEIFGRLSSEGPVPPLEMERVFNMGLGMIVVVPAAEASRAIEIANGGGHDAWVVGSLSEGSGQARVIDP